MMQSTEMKSDDSNDSIIDSDRVYCTNANIKKVGRAVAVDLNDATLPGKKRNKHMAVLFRAGPKWSDPEIAQISKATNDWIQQKMGSHQAPVTFTITEWGPKSVKIEGDLYDLCLYLRSMFSAMSTDKQRIPHCELFLNAERRKNGKGKKHKKDKHDKKERRHSHKYKSPKACDPEKVKQRIERMIGKTQQLKETKVQEISLLDIQEQHLRALLTNADNLDGKALRNEIKNIAKTFKIKRKEMNGFGKGRNGKGRGGGRGRGRGRGGKIHKHKDSKSKQERKEFNKQRKEQKKLEREERKRLKKEKVAKLNAARLQVLPTKAEIGNNSHLNIYVDGYNIIGCDGICRKGMRGKGGGMKKSRQRIAKLLQENFLNRMNNLNLAYNVNMKLWFDGNGKDSKYGDIEVTFSSKKQIVDDKLVELFSKNTKSENMNILVITSDRELTLRLHDIGVKVMRSGAFYKQFLKDQHKADNMDADNMDADNMDTDNNEQDDQKKEEMDVDNTADDDNDDEFVKVMAKKLNYSQLSGDETTGDYSEGADFDEGENTPDEVEGFNPNDEEDYEFTAIFGEDMAVFDLD